MARMDSGTSEHRDYMAGRYRQQQASVREIGEIPVIADADTRKRCEHDLASFIMAYAPEGKAPFSEDHHRVIKRIENAIKHGGRFVEAVYRGFGKSTVAELTAVWAVAYGHKRFVVIVGSNQTRATDNLNSIKGVFESDALLDGFPEICHPIQCLEGIAQRAAGQTYRGESTHIEWSGDYLVMPMTDGAKDENGEWYENRAAGSVILSCGITSSKIRGMKKRRGDGVQLRPDFVIIDDPQDEESANSPNQVNKRLNIIKKAILKSAGHTESMSVVMPCTVIQKDDLVDQLLDAKKNPAWQGERIPFVRSWAKEHDKLWLGEYKDIRTTYDKEDPDDYLRARKQASEFYEKHRKKMDEGCVVSWEHCFRKDEDEISAIQHAYNALIDDGEDVFASEFQNEPFLPPEEEGQLTSEEVYGRLNNISRRDVPQGCEKITAFVDVQGSLLYYLVCAWREDFTGFVIDYGTFPEQAKGNFQLRQATRTLQRKYPGKGQEGCWRAGFEELTDLLIGREWKRDDGVGLRISRLLIDANDGNASATVYDFCRQSVHAAVVMPSRGRGVTASAIPFCDYRRNPGDRVSEFNWRIPARQGKNAIRYILYDVNYWKSFLRSRLRVGIGDSGALTVFGKSADAHRMLCEHMTSEYSVRTEGRGRTVDEWRMRPSRTENHWFDCAVGCCVAASEQGIVLKSATGGARGEKKRIKLSDLQRQRRLGA